MLFRSIVYHQLKRTVSKEVRRWPRSRVLEQTTSLAHEVYLRVLRPRSVPWENRAHFYGALARAACQLLIELTRREERVVRDEPARPEGAAPDPVPTLEELLDLRASLEELETIHARAARILRGQYFLGMTIDQLSEAFALGHAQVEKDLRLARVWLLERMSREVPR